MAATDPHVVAIDGVMSAYPKNSLGEWSSARRLARLVQSQVFLESQESPRSMLRNQGLRGRLREGFWNGVRPMAVFQRQNRMIGYDMACLRQQSAFRLSVNRLFPKRL